MLFGRAALLLSRTPAVALSSSTASAVLLLWQRAGSARWPLWIHSALPPPCNCVTCACGNEAGNSPADLLLGAVAAATRRQVQHCDAGPAHPRPPRLQAVQRPGNGSPPCLPGLCKPAASAPCLHRPPTMSSVKLLATVYLSSTDYRYLKLTPPDGSCASPNLSCCDRRLGWTRWALGPLRLLWRQTRSSTATPTAPPMGRTATRRRDRSAPRAASSERDPGGRSALPGRLAAGAAGHGGSAGSRKHQLPPAA